MVVVEEMEMERQKVGFEFFKEVQIPLVILRKCQKYEGYLNWFAEYVEAIINKQL